MKIGQFQTINTTRGRRILGQIDVGETLPVKVKVIAKIGSDRGCIKFQGPVTSSSIKVSISGNQITPKEVLTVRNDRTIGEVIIGSTEIFNGGNTKISRSLHAISHRSSTDLGFAIDKVASDHLSWLSAIIPQLSQQ